MTLILRKCNKDGLSSRRFYYGYPGDIVTAPNWNPEPKCGNGLHGLKNGNGNWSLLTGDDWLVIEAADEDIVDIDDEKCKFRTGKILYRGGKEGLGRYASKFLTDSQNSYYWGLIIGDREIMRDRIISSEDAYYWATDIGDREIMRDRITESMYAYYWARNIGDIETMRERITESEYAYWWARRIGDKEVMRERIDTQHISGWLEFIDYNDKEYFNNKFNLS